MKKNVTIYDIAKKLHVSAPTVNRALNNNPKISKKTRKLVSETANELGYKPNKIAKSLTRKAIRIGFIIHDINLDFNNKVLQGAKKACEDLVDYKVVGDFYVNDTMMKPQEIIECMVRMGNEGCDGIVLCPTEDVRQYNQIIEDLYNRNIPVVTVISDIPDSKRIFSIRTNASVAGKMAEELLYLVAKGKPVAIFTVIKDIGVHKENMEGFMEHMKVKPLDLVAVYENYDDLDIAWNSTEKLLKDYPDIVGLYITSSNSMMVCKKIIEEGYAGKIKIVASDTFPELLEYIKSGVVYSTIFQEPFNIGRLAFKNLYEYLSEGKKFQEEILLNPQIVLSGNIELFT